MSKIVDLAAQAGINALAEQASYGLGEITGYNQALKNDQIEQQKKLGEIGVQNSMQLMDKSVQQQKEMFDYTSPAKRVQQLKEAGLNPGLIYGMGGAGGSTTGSGAIASQSGGNASDEMSRKMANIQSVGMGLQLAKLQSEIDVNKSIEAANLADANKKSGIDTEIGKANLRNILLSYDGILADNRNKNIQGDLMELDKVSKKIDNYFKENTVESNIEAIEIGLDKMRAETRSIIVRADVDEATKDTLIEQFNTNLINTQTEIELKKSHIKVNDEEIKAIKQSVKKAIAETHQINQLTPALKAELEDRAKAHLRNSWASMQGIETVKEGQYTQEDINTRTNEQSERNAYIHAISSIIGTVIGALILKRGTAPVTTTTDNTSQVVGSRYDTKTGQVIQTTRHTQTRY